MKKIYMLSALICFGALTTDAQVSKQAPSESKKQNVNSNDVARRSAPAGVNHSNSIIWYDDFSVPGNWTLTVEPGTTGDWTIGTNPPTGGNAINEINSPSVINGYALFDSDAICSGNQIANLTTTNPLDLSGHTNIRLAFEEYYARFRDSTFVFVSTDGTNWTKFSVNTDLGVNEVLEFNSTSIEIDISSVAGNQDSVWIRFQYYSPSSLGIGAGCCFSWMIDDVLIFDISDVDAAILRPFPGEYPMYPIIQPEALQLRGRINNYGLQPITGARIDYAVADLGLNLLHVDTSAPSPTINPGDTSTFLSAWNGSYDVQDTGFFIVEHTAVMPGDTVGYNDTRRGFFYVSDSIYARDNFDINGRIDGSYGFNPPGSGYMGQMFQIFNPSQVSSASFFLSDPKFGAQVRVTFYSVVSGAPGVLLGSSANYTITAADTTPPLNMITLPFQSAISVTPGQYFLAINQVDTNFLSISASDNVYTPGKVFYRGAASTNWTTFDSQNFKVSLILRLNNPSATLVGVKEKPAESSFSVYPNPSSGMIYINGSGTTKKDVMIKIINPLGQIIKSEFFKSFNNEKIDLSGFPSGLYKVNISTTEGESNISVVID